jgi:hypothetical protein
VPRHPSFLLKIFYMSLSPSFSLFLPFSFSLSVSLPLSLFLSLSLSLRPVKRVCGERMTEREREKEGGREGEREKEGGREIRKRELWAC